MSSLNKVMLIGNLGKDPEIRSTQAGKKIANFSLATSERWTDKQSGNKNERTEWHRVVVFNERLSEIVQKFLRKGSKVYLEGQLQTRKWVAQDGSDRYSTEIALPAYGGVIVMLGDPKGEPGEDRQETPRQSTGSAAASAANGSVRGQANYDDDIPF